MGSDRTLDLNRMRETVLNSRVNGDSSENRDKRIYAKLGKILSPEQAEREDPRQLSEVPKETFYASRLEQEAMVAKNKMPPGTRLIESSGIKGWLYDFTCELGEYYKMFAYHNGSSYQVKLIHPEHEGRYTPYRGHLYPDGTLCLAMGMGMPTLEAAYAKSLLWATGFSALRLGGEFPF